MKLDKLISEVLELDSKVNKSPHGGKYFCSTCQQCADYFRYQHICYTSAPELARQCNILKEKLMILQRYHGGDGSITREKVFEALAEVNKEKK